MNMKHQDYNNIIPAQETGKDIEAEASVELANDADAINFYHTAKKRLLQVNQWHQIAGLISAKFQLTDENGEEINREAEQDNYIRVDIPGPGSKEGDGYDWALIEELREVAFENIQSIGFRVRPAANPKKDSEHVAHFYDPSATSNFVVTREGNIVTATIIDRNTKPNDDAESVMDKIRHTVAGMSALSAFSKIQWQNLAEGLVREDMGK
jgi:hypothetical protein